MIKHFPTQPSQRQYRVGELIRKALASILAQGSFADSHVLHGLSLTVSEVRVSGDLRHAHVFVSALNAPKGDYKEQVIRMLNEMSPVLFRELAKHVRMKYLPRLVFKLDQSFDYAESIETLLDQLGQESSQEPSQEE